MVPIVALLFLTSSAVFATTYELRQEAISLPHSDFVQLQRCMPYKLRELLWLTEFFYRYGYHSYSDPDLRTSIGSFFGSNRYFPRDCLLVTEREAPVIYAAISDIAKKMKTEIPLVFIATQDIPSTMIASFMLPWGKLGILVGTRAVKILSDIQFHAAIAHEMTHISRSHRLKRKIAAMVGAMLAGTIIMSGYYWRNNTTPSITEFSVLFSAYIFSATIAKTISDYIGLQQEYEADKKAAEIVSKASLKETLLLLEREQVKTVSLSNNDYKEWKEYLLDFAQRRLSSDDPGFVFIQEKIDDANETESFDTCEIKQRIIELGK